MPRPAPEHAYLLLTADPIPRGYTPAAIVPARDRQEPVAVMAACSGWLGTKWESLALSRALHGSVLLACARCHLREHGSSLVAGMGMLSWGSRGRRFKSGRPDAGQRPLWGFREGLFGSDGSAARDAPLHLRAG
jgi:hypothetical protein